MNVKSTLGKIATVSVAMSLAVSAVAGASADMSLTVLQTSDTDVVQNSPVVQSPVTKQSITDISVTLNAVTAPVAGSAVQTTVPSSAGYKAALSWTPSVAVYGYNTSYTANLTLTPDAGYTFGAFKADGWTVTDINGTKKLSKVYPATRTEKLISMVLPINNIILDEYKPTAASVISTLPSKIKIKSESGAEQEFSLSWSCQQYNATPSSVNTFVWTVQENAYKGKYDVSALAMTGNITVTNASAITVNSVASDAEITYNGSVYNVAQLFNIDVNAGAASYALTGGSGSASLNGSELTITGSGTFDVTLTTAANGAYGAGEATATLTVAKAVGEGSVTAEDFEYGDALWSPVPVSGTNGIENVTYFYKVKGADDSTYSSELPDSVGDYTVKAVFAQTDLYTEVIATDDFTVLQATPVISDGNEPTVKRLKKRSTLSKAIIDEGVFTGTDGSELSGTYSWSEPDKVMITDGTETLVFTPDNANYKPVEINVEVDVYSSYDHSTLSSATATHTVTFVSNGGSKVESQKVVASKKAIEPYVPEREGYIFDGWYTDRNLTYEYNFDRKITKNITLYAKWVEDEEDNTVVEPEQLPPEEDVTVENNSSEEDVKPEETNPEVSEEQNGTYKDIPCDGTFEEGCLSRNYYDLAVNEWYHQSIDFVLRNGIMNGTGYNTFEPDSELTRAMLVTVLYRMENEPYIAGTAGFNDVESGSYYEDAVAWAKANNIVNGHSADRFAPDDYITREQFAAIMYRYAIYKNYDVSVGENTNILSYGDVHEISNYAITAFQYTVGAGLMNGKTEQTLNPQDCATRAEAAAILHRFATALR